MKRKIKSKLILCIIIVNLALTGIICNDFNVKHMDDSQNAKNDVINSLRDSNGNWETLITKSAGNSPHSIFIGDSNNDGYNDIATANYYSDDISIFLWNSTSDDWDPQIVKSVGAGPRSVFIGDVNNDGDNDIATANAGSNDLSILLWNTTSGDWDSQITRSVGAIPWSVFIGDANNDGYNDIATANAGSDDLSIFLWNSISGDWNPQITRSIGDDPRCLFIGDANNDGYNDIATANNNPNYVSIILWNSTSGDWNPQFTRSAGGGPISVFIGDANNDGYYDIVTANWYSFDISILLWNNLLGDWFSPITKSVGTYPDSLFIGDANNDGYNDIVTANDYSNDVSILLWNITSDNLEPQITKAVGNGPRSVFIGDANNDGYNDIATANYDSNDISILLWKPPYISIISPESKVYGPLKGYYPATYGFDYDPDGNFPREWTLESNGGTCQVIQSLGDHKKVVELYDSSVPDGYIGMINNFTSKQTEGTVEFYFRSNDTNKHTDIYLYENSTNDGIRLTIMLNNLWYYKSMTFVGLGTTMESNRWYHFRIEFNSTTNTFWLWVDSTRITIYGGDYPYQNNNTGMNHLSLTTYVYDMNYSSYFDAIGYSWDSAYDVGDNIKEGMRLTFYNNTHLDWIAYSLDGQDNITIFEQEIIPLPEDGPHSIRLFGRDAESGEIVESEIRYFTVDILSPEIIINSPISGETFGCMAPKYNISIIEPNLESIWYTIDGGITNFTINKLSGFIDQHAWVDAPLGSITISFYIKDAVNNTNYEEVVITKTKLLSIDIINQSFSSSEFRIEFYVYNESGEAIDFASIQMWWDGIDVSSDVQNLGHGYYSVSLEPITVAPGEDPILLNMTISASGYGDKYFETYIGVHPSDLVEDTLELGIVDQSFSTEEFNITFFIHNKTGFGIEFATIHMWWNGVDVSANIQNLGSGLYFISLEPITVAPGEDPILLNMTISASGFEDKYFETYIAVDPDTLQKGVGRPSEEIPLFLIITISIVSIGAIIGLAAIFWYKRRGKEIA